MFRESLNGFLSRHDHGLRTLCRIGLALSILTICVLSLLPEDELPDTDLSDKVSHLIAYGEITAIGLLSFRGRLSMIAVPLCVVALGGALEIGQMFVPSRSADLLDFAANCIGVAVGYGVARLLLRFWPLPIARHR
jgi:VanZ family protein